MMHAPPPELRELPLTVRSPEGPRPLLALSLPAAARAPAGFALAVRLPGAERYETTLFETAHGELRFSVPPRTRGRVTVRLSGLAGSGRAPFVTAGATVGADPDARRTLRVVASAHTDLGYTAAQADVARAHADNVLTGLELADRHDGFVWNLECLWQLDALREIHGERAFRRALDALRERRLGASSLYLLMLPGMLSSRMLARYTGLAVELRRRHRLRLRAATLTDIPTAPHAWPSLLRAGGVRWLIHGINNYCAVPWRPEELAGRPGPVRWVAPDGKSVVVTFARWPQDRPAFGPGYAQLQALGLAGDGVVNLRVPDAERAVELFLRDHASAPRGLPLLVHGAYFENARLTERLPKTVAAFRAKYAAPEIRFTTAEGYFEELLGDDPDGRSLPVVRGTGGAYWESGIASTARETGWFREAMHGYEVLEDVAPRALARRCDSVEKPLILFGEHTWGAAESVTRPDSEQSLGQRRWKMRRLAQARRALHEELRGAARRIVRGSRGRTLVVACGGAKSGSSERPETPSCFECCVPRGTTPAERGVPLPSSLLSRFAGCERRLVRAPAPLAPGLHRFELHPVPGGGETVVLNESSRAGRFANELRIASSPLTLTVGRDGRLDLFESDGGAELTDPRAPFGLGEWIHAAGGDRSRLVATEWIDGAMTFYPDAPRLATGRPRWKTRSVFQTPLGPRVELRGEAPFTPRLRLLLQLHSDAPRADLELFVTRTANRAKEAAYVALPFALARPRLVFDAAGSPCDFARDLLPGAARDWIAAGRWLELSMAGAAGRFVTIAPQEAALFTVGDLFRGEWAAARAPSSRLFAYVMNNYWPTNYAAEQSGPARFRFSLQFGRGATSRARARTAAESTARAVVV